MELRENNVVASRSLTTKANYIRLGFIRSAHALSGEMELHLDIPSDILDSFPQYLYLWRSSDSKPHFYLKENHLKSLKDYEVETVRPFKKGALLKLKACKNREDAESLQGMLVYLNTQNEKLDSSYLFWFLGFEVFRMRGDELESLGSIDHFQSHSHQDWAIINNGKKKIEIPFVSEYIEKMDEENRKLILNLPDLFPNLDETKL